MWTVSQVAERDRISKQAVSKAVRKLAAEHGLIVERDAKDRIVKLNVVQFDQLRGKFGDPSKAQAPKVKSETRPPAANSRDEAMRLQAWTEAERSRLALDELKGLLIRVEAIIAAIESAAAVIAGIIDRLPNAADDLAASVARDGTHGLRLALVKEAQRLRAEIADTLRAAKPAASTPAAPIEQEVAPAEPVMP